MAKVAAPAAPKPKASLTRGIDPIPENWELASGDAAIRGLCRAITTLERFEAKSRDRAAARDLKRVATACHRALSHITGGFDRKYIQPKANRWAAAIAEARRNAAKKRIRALGRAAFDNAVEVTRG
jgi:hypothetical protein